jgi:hypothetical protein
MLDDLDSADDLNDKTYWQPGTYRCRLTELHTFTSNRNGAEGVMLKAEILEVLDERRSRVLKAENGAEFSVPGSNRVGDMPGRPIVGGDVRLNRREIKAYVTALNQCLPEDAQADGATAAAAAYIVKQGEKTPLAGIEFIADVSVNDKRTVEKGKPPFPNLTIKAIPAEDQPNLG